MTIRCCVNAAGFALGILAGFILVGDVEGWVTALALGTMGFVFYRISTAKRGTAWSLVTVTILGIDLLGWLALCVIAWLTWEVLTRGAAP
jgi:hypothetical protein